MEREYRVIIKNEYHGFGVGEVWTRCSIIEQLGLLEREFSLSDFEHHFQEITLAEKILKELWMNISDDHSLYSWENYTKEEKDYLKGLENEI